MIRYLSVSCAALLLGTGLAAAQPAPAAAPAATPPAAAAPVPVRRERSAAQEAQQQRMRACNAQAAERTLRGDARRDFMRECLSASRRAAAATPAAGTAAAAPAATGESRQGRMRDCSAQARSRGLAGEPRRTFLSACLAGGAPAADAPAAPARS